MESKTNLKTKKSSNAVFKMSLLFGLKYPISHQLKVQGFFCMGLYAFHNSISFTRLQLPVLNFCLLYQASFSLYQASLPNVKFSDCCHSAHELV